MIKATELRIGNLIFWNPTLANPETTLHRMQVEVTSITQEKIGYLSPRVEHRVEPFEDDLLQLETQHGPLEEFEPIPLTAELLETCGFEDGTKAEWQIKFSGAEASGYAVSFGEVKLGHITSLHELQNIYHALKGEELEVNLFI